MRFYRRAIDKRYGSQRRAPHMRLAKEQSEPMQHIRDFEPAAAASRQEDDFPCERDVDPARSGKGLLLGVGIGIGLWAAALTLVLALV